MGEGEGSNLLLTVDPCWGSVVIFAIFSLAMLYRGRALKFDVSFESRHNKNRYAEAIEDR